MDLMQWRRSGIGNPAGELQRLQREINDLFDFDRADVGSGLFDRTESPAIDVVEREGDFEITCDLPGVEQKDLDLSIADNVLTIKGEKREGKDGGSSKTYRREIWAGAFQRTLSLPRTVDSAGVDATLRNGVLKIVLPKREEARPRQISVKVK